jgi:hypothetical protein
MTRQLRNASAIYGDCDGSPQSNIAFYDQIGTLTQFSCQGLETDDGFIASSTANIRVTSPKVNIVTCEFTCQPGAVGGTDSILMVVSGVDTENAGIESARVDLQTQVNLRNY